MQANPALSLSPAGLYCAAGDFYIDPWRRVERAIITHAHSDHARAGMGKYLCPADGAAVLRQRVGQAIDLSTLGYGEEIQMGKAKVSLHPAGHILGSCQVRVEVDGYVAVVSGDYKVEKDVSCESFEPVRCHLFITESTFGLPIYRWQPQNLVGAQINEWWRSNQRQGFCSLLTGYALGKAQRALTLLDDSIGPIFCHGSVENFNEIYLREGRKLPTTQLVSLATKSTDWTQAIVVCPGSALGSPWVRRFGESRTAFMSGWMAVRGMRRWSSVDRGFVLSDHADWPGLLDTIRATGAESIGVTHGYVDVLVRHLQGLGLDAFSLGTKFEGEAAPAARGNEEKAPEDAE